MKKSDHLNENNIEIYTKLEVTEETIENDTSFAIR